MTADALDTVEPRLVVHCFRAWDTSGSEETYISPESAFVQSCVDLCADGQQSACFIESSLPETAALGILPAAFIDGHPACRELLCYSLRRFVAVEEVAVHGAGSLFPSTEAWVAHTHEVMSAITDLALWVHRPCYSLHTKPAMLRGACNGRAGTLVRMLLARFCRNRRWHACNALLETPASAILERFESFMSSFEGRLGARKSQLDGTMEQPRLEDLVLFSYAQTLVVIPDSLAPWKAGTAGMARLKRFHADLAQQLCLHRTGSVPRRRRLSFNINELQQCPVLGSKPEGSARDRTSQGSKVQAQTSSGSATGNSSSNNGNNNHSNVAEGDLIPASQRRTNTILVVWWLASFGAFFVWSRRQGAR
eukprot:CAMPEP_0172832042 /NCGR_PEP_ID=MMETSP1075-20121228/23394_1 /TAXON_ID=2916 /ORGANISM="Ceratium fusus, Strain PA161109" /LENGTH=364 /DNA_ID=CAMNT_0013674591 /DNA_START=115 /DNA_END=1206 /DNA_ORIENTATION=+